MKYLAWLLVAALGMAAGCGGEESGSASSPAGVTAAPVAPIVPEWPSVPGAWTQQASGTSADVTAVAALDADHAWIADAAGQIRRTQDGGATWLYAGVLPLHISMPTSPTLARQLHFIDAFNGWAVSERMLISTSDGGETWTKRKETLPSTNMPGMISWMKSETFHNVSFVSPTEGWLAASQGVRHTTDGGETWTAIQIDGKYVAGDSIHFIDSQTGWLLNSNHKLYKTSDQGQTWQVHGLVDQTSGNLSAVDDSCAWVLGGGTVYRTAPGNAWFVQQVPGSFNIQFVDLSHGWVVGNKIHHTSDGGTTWTEQTTPQSVFSDFAFVSASVGWVVGDEGLILKTETGGQ